MRAFTLLLLLLLPCPLWARQVVLSEGFETTIPPHLPTGWSTTSNRQSAGDFTTGSSVPNNGVNAVVSTNATVSQSLTSPPIDFSERTPGTLSFFERRSASHTSGLLVEVSTDGGASFDVRIGDTLYNPGTTSYVRRLLALPPSLGGSPSVVFRWRVIGNGAGTTGTIRFDDIVITAGTRIDAAVSDARVEPPFPTTADSISLVVRVRNAGSDPFAGLRVDFFAAAPADSAPAAGTLLGRVSLSDTLRPGDSATARSPRFAPALPEILLTAHVSLAGDGDTLNNNASIIVPIGIPRGSVVISEIMYGPKAGEPEWVEIASLSPAPVELRNWRIGNRNTPGIYPIAQDSAALPFGGRAVVTKDTALLRSAHPGITGLLLQSSPMPTFLFNNSGDAVVLSDFRGAVIDSVRYSPAWGGREGTSLERIESDGASNDSANWASCVDSSGSTPDAPNSVTPLDEDLRLAAVASAYHSGSARIEATVKNTGRTPALVYSVSVWLDANDDSTGEDGELVGTESNAAPLAPRGEAHFFLESNDPPSGRHIIIARVDYAPDMRPSDNILTGTLTAGYPRRSVVVNEIMYDPLAGQSEYVELYNRLDVAVDLAGWKISDRPDTALANDRHNVSAAQLVLPAHGYLVVAADTSIEGQFPSLRSSPGGVAVRPGAISLNNEGDAVILTDLAGAVVDSVRYSPSWHNPALDNPIGRSLEKIDPGLDGNDGRNWGTSASPQGGTPGRQNSLFTHAVESASALSVSPNPFSPDGDGHDDVAAIHYALRSPSAVIRLRIYDVRGRLVRTLADGEPAAGEGTLIWDGFTDARRRAPMGIYILLLDGTDASGAALPVLKGIVVVAARL